MSMAGHDIIVIGASAGGVEALRQLVNELPADLPASLFVVLHIPPQSPSVLPYILERAGKLTALHPQDGAKIEHGHIYIAPPDRHLLVDRDLIRVTRGPKENRYRPAVDPLFRSAARSYGPRVVGVILTGALDDGTAGLRDVKQRGGVAVVQDPLEALYSGMPSSALANVRVDYCLPLAEVAPTLVRLAHEPAAEEGAYPVPDELEIENSITENNFEADMEAVNKLGAPSNFTCPECHGTLWEIRDGELLRFRCHVGHAYSADSLLAEQNEGLEDALWAAVRSLEENAHLARRVARRLRERDEQNRVAERMEDKAQRTEQHAQLVRQMLLQGEPQREAVGAD
jgi:two-component system, chemotaxis family, protein-glutamate methylesterase/glutaminase